ncbi:MAG: heavy-metal-associated domain-containing protein [Leptotrichiaceae bacterium]|nr:heavy-metal-associated domain-containing protein [Leptotrichiaceae bacterium]MBP7100683.1 heavy-metal-associated domain-containing protein [Leptotrichiaceae bacterium]MBP7725625.1 heavy-metal-associated domain-containing protein [Leptotrichiaceae bacterium]MBP9629427.1 heavy-metal-associated domain-containing protein [Leptotrichiaceae bacterium]
MKKIINITGMNCTHCVEKIKNTLYGLPQIDDVNISLEENKAEVVFNSDVKNELIKNLIDSSGNFNVTDINEI